MDDSMFDRDSRRLVDPRRWALATQFKARLPQPIGLGRLGDDLAQAALSAITAEATRDVGQMAMQLGAEFLQLRCAVSGHAGRRGAQDVVRHTRMPGGNDVAPASHDRALAVAGVECRGRRERPEW